MAEDMDRLTEKDGKFYAIRTYRYPEDGGNDLVGPFNTMSEAIALIEEMAAWWEIDDAIDRANANLAHAKSMLKHLRKE